MTQPKRHEPGTEDVDAFLAAAYRNGDQLAPIHPDVLPPLTEAECTILGFASVRADGEGAARTPLSPEMRQTRSGAWHRGGVLPAHTNNHAGDGITGYNPPAPRGRRPYPDRAEDLLGWPNSDL